MDRQDCGDFLESSRDLSSFELRIQTAKSKAEAGKVLREYNLSDENFTNGFPYLAKTVRDMPDETSPSA